MVFLDFVEQVSNNVDEVFGYWGEVLFLVSEFECNSEYSHCLDADAVEEFLERLVPGFIEAFLCECVESSLQHCV